MSLCPLCQRDGKRVLFEDRKLRIVVVDDLQFPGYFQVIWNQHKAEMSDLSDGERVYVWQILHRIEKILRQYTKCDKVNLAQFGNMVPHLHWHLIARYKEDANFPESIWGAKQRDVPESLLSLWRQMAEVTAQEIQKEFLVSNLKLSGQGVNEDI